MFLNAAPNHLGECTSFVNMKLNLEVSNDGETPQSLGKRSTEYAGDDYITWNTPSNKVPAEILALAHETGSTLRGDGSDVCTIFTPPDAGLLRGLTKRYPNGTMWTFGQAGLITPTESFPSEHHWTRRLSTSGAKAWRQQREIEAETLRQYFPTARQLIFAPLFDAAMERSTAGSVVIITPYTAFSDSTTGALPSTIADHVS